MSAPEPRANPNLVGHGAAEAEFLAAARHGRLHHAWLITGAIGIGKATLAYRLARRLLAGLPARGESAALDPADPVFRRVAAGAHADLKTLTLGSDSRTGKLKHEIVVDDVRASTSFLHRTAIEGGWRILIVDPAELLNTNAQNALLKVVEEPPERTLVFLVSAAPGRLSVTLRSRCRWLRLAPLATEDVEKLLLRYREDLPDAERKRLAEVAQGSPGRALRLAEKGGAAVASLAAEALAAMPNLAPIDAHALADRLGRDEDAFAVFMDLLLGAVATAVRAGARGRASPAETRLLGGRSLAASGEVWQAVTDLARETERLNLDKHQALVSGLMLLNGP